MGRLTEAGQAFASRARALLTRLGDVRDAVRPDRAATGRVVLSAPYAVGTCKLPRVVVATNRDLQTMVSGRRFREDLFYRLTVFPIELPPLRERREDIPDLARHFVAAFERRTGRRIAPLSEELVAELRAQRWAGNVRELQNAIERAAIPAGGFNHAHGRRG